eukprot:GHUV01008653.1.p1 GENE.GHUV01008653.1~~GHUV01008653.1.p1  ORF type:complete len:114 (+),score=52.24 GHUV01008653.1:206-547(+)
MPEVRRFFYESVLEGEYGDKLTVKFIPGATPELIMYGPDDEELSREVVQNMSFDELHAFVQFKGFQKVKPLHQEEHQQEIAEGDKAAEADDADAAAESEDTQQDVVEEQRQEL